MDPRRMVNIISRNNRNNQKLKPEAVQDYIDHMAGVDKSDQLIGTTRSSSCCCTTLSSPCCCTTPSSSCCCTTPSSPCCCTTPSSSSPCCYTTPSSPCCCTTPSSSCCCTTPSVPAAAPPPPVPAAVGQTRLVGCGHYSTPIGQVESGTGRKKFRACHVCSSRAKRHVGAKVRKTANVCAKCGVPLCDKIIQPQGNGDITCFRLYHTVKNYTDY
ncbi:hypothetical protein ACOMHN_044776 [Nucella lapillus]